VVLFAQDPWDRYSSEGNGKRAREREKERERQMKKQKSIFTAPLAITKYQTRILKIITLSSPQYS